MGSKKEEERNEKIIRGLMKLPPNRRCINCNSLGPQYVCTNFWTFICIACSGIHREFTHRVKSVSMAKFTAQEVEALQMGGNQRARELFLKDWDMQRMRFPDSSNPDKLREFIRNVYVNKKYAGTRSFDKPPRDTQSIKGHEEDHRRASSYHSFSQSPPYDHQYEERRYGKQAGMLTRKPGSDRGHYEGKLSSFMYSPGRPGEQMNEDRFANENSGSRISDFSVSSGGDPFRLDAQSPNFRDPGYGSPPSQVRDILAEETRPQTTNLRSEFNVKRDLDNIPQLHRTASSGSFGSTDSNSVSLRSANSGSLVGAVLEPEQSLGVQQADRPANPALSQISSAGATNGDLLNPLFSQPAVAYSVPAIDLFADVSHQPSLTAPSDQTPLSAPFEAKFATSIASIDIFADISHQPSQKLPSEHPPVKNTGDGGWATFDLPHQVGPSFEVNKGFSSLALPSDEAPKKLDVFPSLHNASEWFTVQSSASHVHSLPMADQWHMGLNDVNDYADSRNSQSWNAFDDSTRNLPQTSLGSLPSKGESEVLLHRPPTSVDQYASLKAPEIPLNDMFASPPVDDKVSTFDVDESSFPPSALRQGGLTFERKSTNPFDLPFDSDPEPDNLFMDMSSIQAALPDQQLPATFLDGLPQPWFQQNTLTAFIPPAPQGGLAYIGGQVPSSQLPNIPSEGPVASLGGNPFA